MTIFFVDSWGNKWNPALACKELYGVVKVGVLNSRTYLPKIHAESNLHFHGFHAVWLDIVIWIRVVRRKLHAVLVIVFLEAASYFVVTINFMGQIISAVAYVSTQCFSTDGTRPTGGTWQSAQ
jgi:hypothetical protein